MTKSAKGTIEEPGTNVAQKSGLNRVILDSCWGEIKRQLEYKGAWHGCNVVYVPAPYSSQECHACEHTCPENRPTRDLFACQNPECGWTGCADENAANVVKHRAETVVQTAGLVDWSEEALASQANAFPSNG